MPADATERKEYETRLLNVRAHKCRTRDCRYLATARPAGCLAPICTPSTGPGFSQLARSTMSSREHSSSDDAKVQSDDVHVDLSKPDNGLAEGEAKSSLLSNVDPARQITITWKNVNVFVPVFSAKKSVLKDPKQLLGPLAHAHHKPDKRQVCLVGRNAER